MLYISVNIYHVCYYDCRYDNCPVVIIMTDGDNPFPQNPPSTGFKQVAVGVPHWKTGKINLPVINKIANGIRLPNDNLNILLRTDTVNGGEDLASEQFAIDLEMLACCP